MSEALEKAVTAARRLFVESVPGGWDTIIRAAIIAFLDTEGMERNILARCEDQAWDDFGGIVKMILSALRAEAGGKADE